MAWLGSNSPLRIVPGMFPLCESKTDEISPKAVGVNRCSTLATGFAGSTQLRSHDDSENPNRLLRLVSKY